MKTLIGGAIAAALGLIGIVIWWAPFLQFLAGTIPAILLLGGGLAIYLGFDELKDSWKKDDVEAPPVQPSEDVDKYKEEIDSLKKELESVKNE